MEDNNEKKRELCENIQKQLKSLSDQELSAKNKALVNRLFEFANFIESKIVLLYLDGPGEVPSRSVLERSLGMGKIVILPAFPPEKKIPLLLKINSLDMDFSTGARGVPAPDPAKCKAVPFDCIDIAVIPGIVFDEKGGRIGYNDAYYDRLIPDLPITTRKVSLAYEEQIVQQVPTGNSDKHVDILITDKRTIYKI